MINQNKEKTSNECCQGFEEEIAKTFQTPDFQNKEKEMVDKQSYQSIQQKRIESHKGSRRCGLLKLFHFIRQNTGQDGSS